MKKIKIIISTVLIVSSLFGGTAFANKYVDNKVNAAYEEGRKFEQEEQKALAVPVNETEVINQRFENVARLETADYVCTCVDNYEDVINLKEDMKIPLNVNIPLTKKSYIVSFTGTVSAGINDLTKAKVKKTEDGTIIITLPKITVFDPVVDNNSLIIYDENNNLLNKLSITDFNQSMIRVKSEIKSKAIENNVENLAKENAEAIVLSMFADLETVPIIKWS